MSFRIGTLQSGLGSTIAFSFRTDPRPERSRARSPRARASNGVSPEKSYDKRLSVCTADELHFVSVPNSDWSLALWRYLPSSQVKKQRNHPLLLLSGIATNAIGYDLSPECSFARYMSGNGFDTWILELRGSGLSSLDKSSSANNYQKNSLSNSRLSSFLSEGALQGQEFVIGSKIRDTSQWLAQSLGLRDNLSHTIEDFQKQFELIFKYDWDFDNILEEDLPAAMEYIRNECKTEDGKLHAIGHSMGGILLYSRLSQFCSKGTDSGLVSITTLGSSLDYSTSRSSLKLLLPVADPARALNVPAIPIGAMLAAIHPFVSHPPYLLFWLKGQVSAHEMMQPELYEKLLLNNFCTIPAKLLLQLASAFYKGGLCNRNKTFFYKDHLHKANVPVLAISGDRDLICPPEAVYETVKHIPEHMVTLKIVGEPGGPHYAHYDVVGSHLATQQVYPYIIEFLNHHDS